MKFENNPYFASPLNLLKYAPELNLIKNQMRTAHGVECLTYDVNSDCWTVRFNNPRDLDAAIAASSEALHFPEPIHSIDRGDDQKLRWLTYTASLPGIVLYCNMYGSAAEEMAAYLESKEV